MRTYIKGILLQRHINLYLENCTTPGAGHTVCKSQSNKNYTWKLNVTSSRGLCVKKRRQLYEWRIHAWVNEVGQYGSDKCLPPNQCQAVAWPILAHCHREYKVQTSIKLKNADCKMSAFCLRLNVLVGKLVTWQITFPSSSSSQEQGDLLSCFCFLFYCPDFQTQYPVLLKIRENDK